MKPIFLVIGLVLTVASVGVATETRWPNWRGPSGNGSSGPGNYPVSWSSTSNVLWKVALPGKGCSTPIVWDDRIFVTAPSEGQDAVLAFDWKGTELWRTSLGAERAGKHRNGSGSNASPTTDGERVYAYFKSGNFAAVDFSGKISWQTNLVEAFGRDSLFWDHGTSPVLTKDAVIMTRLHRGESWLAAFDQKTGALLWKVARNYETPPENDHGYDTPIVFEFGGREALLLWAAERITVHDATNGELLWSAVVPNPTQGKNYPAVASPVLVGDIVVVPFGRSDRGNPVLVGFRLGQAGDPEVTSPLWHRNDTGTFVPTPTVWDRKVVLLRDRGEIDCVDPQTGKSLWTGSLPRASANYYGSPAIAGDKLYAVREDGVGHVARIGEKFEVLAANDMQERVIATPVLLNDCILLRGEKHLFCLGTR